MPAPGKEPWPERKESTYGYTSDHHGIRHGLKDDAEPEAEDATLMLVLCSGFVNYLVEKARKKGVAHLIEDCAASHSGQQTPPGDLRAVALALLQPGCPRWRHRRTFPTTS